MLSLPAQNILNQVSSLRRTQQKFALLSGENFNVFRILGLESREVRTHSAFLGELLNPAGSHGLGDAFLKLFIPLIDFPDFDTSCAQLTIEQYIGQIDAEYEQGGRIDLYLEAAGQYIFIENKIYAGDQLKQLLRYHRHQPKARLVYLTLDGSEPTDWSTGQLLPAGRHKTLSYKKDIANWLEKCRQVASAYPLVRETIVQYQHLINYLTGNTPNDFMKEEMKHLLQSSQDNFVSAAALGQAFDEAREEFVTSLKQELEKEWKTRFSQDLSPLPEFAIYFRVRNGNVYGFEVEQNGKELNVLAEDKLKPLVELALSINKITRPKGWKGWDSWLGWKWMDGWEVANLSLEELYQAATDQEVRTQIFKREMQEAMPYFEQFLKLANAYKGSN